MHEWQGYPIPTLHVIHKWVSLAQLTGLGGQRHFEQLAVYLAGTVPQMCIQCCPGQNRGLQESLYVKGCYTAYSSLHDMNIIYATFTALIQQQSA